MWTHLYGIRSVLSDFWTHLHEIRSFNTRKRHIIEFLVLIFVRNPDREHFFGFFGSQIAMYSAGNKAVIHMEVSFLLQTIYDVVHGRRAGMQNLSKASNRAMPSLFTKFLGLRQTVNICVHRSISKRQIHLLQHPRLDSKIKTLACHSDSIGLQRYNKNMICANRANRPQKTETRISRFFKQLRINI